jgi:putative hydrolase of the HAD superfamily
MKKRIRGMIFDFGGVLGLPQKDEARRAMMQAVGIDEKRFFTSYYDVRVEYDRGTISRREYWTEVLARLDLVLSDEVFETLVKVDVESWVNENPDMIEFLLKNRQKMEKAAILSNMPREFVPSIVDTFDWIDTFDKIYWSCHVHLVKPEKAFYELVADEIGIPIEDCLFIDDSPLNVEGARAAGMEAIHYQDFASFIETFEKEYRLE